MNEEPMDLDKLGYVGPGSGGPCPICGEDMKAKKYPMDEEHGYSILVLTEREAGLLPDTVSGRYWHMSEEHGILEHYSGAGRWLKEHFKTNEDVEQALDTWEGEGGNVQDS